MVVHGDKVTEDDVETDAGVAYGIVEGVDDIQEAVIQFEPQLRTGGEWAVGFLTGVGGAALQTLVALIIASCTAIIFQSRFIFTLGVIYNTDIVVEPRYTIIFLTK